jgi:hypothetical protein
LQLYLPFSPHGKPPPPPPVRKTPLFEPFIYKCDNFTKTGSGQTYGNLKKEWRFSQVPAGAAASCADLSGEWAMSVFNQNYQPLRAGLSVKRIQPPPPGPPPPPGAEIETCSAARANVQTWAVAGASSVEEEDEGSAAAGAFRSLNAIGLAPAGADAAVRGKGVAAGGRLSTISSGSGANRVCLAEASNAAAAPVSGELLLHDAREEGNDLAKLVPCVASAADKQLLVLLAWPCNFS